MRILVVDDSPTLRKLVGGILGRHGHEAVLAADGLAAIDALERDDQARDAERAGGADATPFDLVLLDFVMPRMNGFQFCKVIREKERWCRLPVVLMSAKSDRIRDQFVQQTGALDAISKPFDAQALVATVENVQRRLEQGRASASRLADLGPEPTEETPRSRPAGAGGAQGTGTGRPALEGDLAIVPIGAILQMLQVERHTGTLVVSTADGDGEVTIAMRDGLIDLVQSRGAGDEFRIGRFFVQEGLVTPEEIEVLLEDGMLPPPPSLPLASFGEPLAITPFEGTPRSADSEASLRPTPAPPLIDTPRPPPMKTVRPPRERKRVLGDMLVDAGRVTTDELKIALLRQSSELVYEVLRWTEGRFELRRHAPTPLAHAARLGLPVASLVMEGFRRVDEWRMIEPKIGSFDSIVAKDTLAVSAVGAASLGRPERAVLDVLDRERTVREVMALSHLSSFDACRVLAELVEARLVRRRDP